METVFNNPWVRAIGALLALAGVLFLIYLLSPVLVPLFLAFMAAYVLNPLVNFFERRKVSRGVTILVLALIGVAILVGGPAALVVSVVSSAKDLAEAKPQEEGPAWLHEWLDWSIDSLGLDDLVAQLEKQSLAETVDSVQEGAAAAVEDVADGDAAVDADAAIAETVPAPESPAPKAELSEEEKAARRNDTLRALSQLISKWVMDNAADVLQSNAKSLANVGQRAGWTVFHLFSALGTGLVGILVFFGNFALFAFVSGYLLKDFDGVVEGGKDLVPPRWREKTFSVFGEIDRQLRSFLRGQVIVCLCLGGMYALGFLIADVPFGVFIAALGMVASFVPYLGVVITAGAALFLTLLNSGLDWHLVVVIATVVVAQALEGNVLTPKIVGDQVGLNPVWVILAVLVFGTYLGFLGLVLAVPMAAVLKVLVVEAVRHYRSSAVFAGESASDSEAGEDEEEDSDSSG